MPNPFSSRPNSLFRKSQRRVRIVKWVFERGNYGWQMDLKKCFEIAGADVAGVGEATY
jgi:hypothetical protein